MTSQIKQIVRLKELLKDYQTFLEDTRISPEKNSTKVDDAFFKLQDIQEQFAFVKDTVEKYTNNPEYTDHVWEKSESMYSIVFDGRNGLLAVSAIDEVLADLDQIVAKIQKAESKKRKVAREYSIRFDQLHPKIVSHCKSRVDSGHLSDAVLEACKVVLCEIKEITGISDIDGKPLVERAFSPHNPIIKLNNLTTKSEQDEQAGYLQLYSGLALGIRNPSTHSLLVDEHPLRAMQLLAFASLLMYKLDERTAPVNS